MAKLRTLLDQIDSGELALPEIQRDFVWNKSNVLLLFDSLYRELPIGQMLIWKAKVAIAHKTFKSRRKIKVGQAIDNFYGYLLDGQQRLTALKLVKDRDDYYPLMFSLWPDNEKKPDENRFTFRAKRKKDDPWYVPVADIINKQVSPYQLIERLKASTKDFNPDTDADKIYASVGRLQRILDYEIGVIIYEDDHYRKATELFIRFNSTGKKLKGTDLIAAELALIVPELVSKGINKTCTKFSPRFKFSSTFLIQCLIAVHTAKMNLKNPKDIWLGSDDKKIRQSWKKTERGLGRTLEFISGTIKWDSDSWLPSINSVIPILYLLSQKKFSKEKRKKAREWLLKANLFAIFSGAVHSELDRILRGLKHKPNVQKLIDLTKRDMAKIKPYHFETRRKSGATMSIYISMIRNNNARDWITGTPLDGNVIGHNAGLQVHHFFPQKLLYNNGYKFEEINTFANYTILNKETNLDISTEEPISYLKKHNIKKKDLKAQCIPLDKSLWTVDRYKDFLAARRKLLAKNANLFLSGK